MDGSHHFVIASLANLIFAKLFIKSWKVQCSLSVGQQRCENHNYWRIATHHPKQMVVLQLLGIALTLLVRVFFVIRLGPEQFINFFLRDWPCEVLEKHWRLEGLQLVQNKDLLGKLFYVLQTAVRSDKDMKLWYLSQQMANKFFKVNFVVVNQLFCVIEDHENFDIKRSQLGQNQISYWKATWLLSVFGVFYLVEQLVQMGIVLDQRVIKLNEQNFAVFYATYIQKYVPACQKSSLIDMLQSVFCQTWLTYSGEPH